MKTCVRCKIEKALGEFHKRAVAHDGLNAACKACICAERRARRRRNPEPERAYGALWRSQNPNYSATVAKAWREANPDRARENGQRWAAENRERLAEAKRAWYLANREHVLTWPHRNPEKSRERFKRYRDRHAEAIAEAERFRRAVKAGVEAASVDLDALWTGVCGICAEPLDRQLRWPDPMSKSIDHIIPISKGGRHSQDNLQWTHLVCNVSKGARVEGADLGHPA